MTRGSASGASAPGKTPPGTDVGPSSGNACWRRVFHWPAGVADPVMVQVISIRACRSCWLMRWVVPGNKKPCLHLGKQGGKVGSILSLPACLRVAHRGVVGLVTVSAAIRLKHSGFASTRVRIAPRHLQPGPRPGVVQNGDDVFHRMSRRRLSQGPRLGNLYLRAPGIYHPDIRMEPRQAGGRQRKGVPCQAPGSRPARVGALVDHAG